MNCVTADSFLMELSHSILQVLVLKTDDLQLVASFRVTTGTLNTTAIKSIEFARRGE